MFAPLARNAVFVLDMLLPQRCVGCNAFGADVCDTCCSRFSQTTPLVHTEHTSMLSVTALGSHAGALRNAILALKFRQRRGVAVRLGALLGSRLGVTADYLVPVPLHAARLRERGFNQALEISKGIACVRDIPIADDVIVRRRSTAPQSGLAQRDRCANVARAFEPGLNVYGIRGRTVLLIDDVMTTGATLAACAAVLRNGGAADVSAAVLAFKL